MSATSGAGSLLAAAGEAPDGGGVLSFADAAHDLFTAHDLVTELIRTCLPHRVTP